MTASPAPAQQLTDVMDPARARALQATLGLAQTIGPGDPLPPFFHHIHFWEPVAPDGLGRDGHPRVGGLIPDMGLPRRMWAGGELAFHRPLLAGVPATKTTRLDSATRKEGRSGAFALVRLRHEIAQNGQVCLTEWQDLVYRPDPDPARPASPPPQAPADEERATPFTADATLLFRYSALTFNGHRIHYDAAYAREVEGHGGLVVHGPLLAQLLMLAAPAPLTRFSYRATAPLIAGEAAQVCVKGADLWLRGPDNRLCMAATAG
ncbi:MAG: acyl dehydratase [Limimaricola sp.]|uniref:FAS1-like dehydratase domain-containing protein n=1 Tax=Limimaricola sp. TaxID=2211665 RepID=UPI001E149CF9|nr:MaoC family dehydratase N-terminal domain-containing protein [Limimaricola sp.]MBI1418698.1 acyl dehydratase [Limimaricola sp.]